MAFVLEEPEETKAAPKQGRFVLEEPEEPKETAGQYKTRTGAQYTNSALKRAGEYLARTAARTGARVGETIIGMPGDVTQLGTYIAKALPEPPKMFQREQTFAQKGAQSLLEKIPGSKEVREFTQDIVGDYIKPQSGGEEFADEVISDAAALFIGRKMPTKGGAIAKAWKTIGKPLMVSLGANAVAEGAEIAGAGERTKAFAKIGTMIALDLAGKASPKKLEKELYDTADELLPLGAKMRTPNINKGLKTLEKELSIGGKTITKNPVLKKIEEFRGKFKGGNVEIREAQQFKRELNLEAQRLYDQPKKIQKELRENIDSFRDVLKSSIEEYGNQTGNTKFLDVWNRAEEVHGALEQSAKVRNAIGSIVKKNPRLSAVAAIFGLVKSPTGMAFAVPAAGVMYGGEVVARMWKSPELRNLYIKTVKSAIRENIPAMTKNLSDLDKA